MKLDKNYKVRVTPEQSRKIQELALELGFEWWSSRKKVMYENEPYLFLNSLSEDKFFGAMDNEFEFDVHKFTEIQADDLITLLTELPKSAENPLQNIELTPEFEAVEPKFKVGDKVYVGLTGKIAQVTEIIDDDVVNVANKNNEVRAWVSNICHANPENYERLQATFPDIEFERPPLTGNELCRKLLDKGEKYIMAKDDTDTWRIICDYCDDWFTDVVSGKCLKNVNPVNSKGEPLTEAVLDE